MTRNSNFITALFPLFFFFLQLAHSQLTTSETITLLQIQQKLEYPDTLKSWNRWTNFCYLPPSSTVTVVCSGNHVTSLTITGTKNTTKLSPTFSIDSLFTVITHLQSLQSLSLISLGIWGEIPSNKLTRLTSLKSLNLTHNSISGQIPPSSAFPTTLTSLILAHNSLNATTLPSLSSSLTELDLSYNRLGPNLPSSSSSLPTSSSLITLDLSHNRFRSQIPSSFFTRLTHIQRLDLSSNHLIGPIPSSLFSSLPTLWYLNVSTNRLTGAIPKTTTCNSKLWMVDISSNLLSGPLPICIGSGAGEKKIYATGNCLSGLKYQHPTSVCQTQALAVEPINKGKRKGKKSGDNKGEEEERTSGVKLAIVLAMVAGIVIVFGAIISLLTWAICRRRMSGSDEGSYNYKPVVLSSSKKVTPPGSSAKSPAQQQQSTPPFVSSKYVPTTLRMPALGLPSCRAFTMEELEEATNNFDEENLIIPGGEEAQQDNQGQQLYKGLLQSGAAVLIRRIRLKQKHTSKSLSQHAEVISQLRNQNLVSVIGHCVVFEKGNKGKGSSSLFVVFEYVTNGTLREHLRDWRRKEVLKWPQRMTISMGIARGVHYLHGGIAPGVFGNRLNIDKILLDETLTPKVSGYRIPLPSKEGAQIPPNAEKDDIYQLGAILLEILTGKQITSENQLQEFKQELERSLTEPASVMHQSVDPVLRGSFAYQSVRTAAEITISCLSKDPNRRPSMEDVLWYLQYSIQAQQTWTTSGNLGVNSGNIGFHLK